MSGFVLILLQRLPRCSCFVLNTLYLFISLFYSFSFILSCASYYILCCFVLLCDVLCAVVMHCAVLCVFLLGCVVLMCYQ